MPTKLHSTTINAPGMKGLNTEKQAALLGPEWATIAQNCVFDSAGRVASKPGYVDTFSNSLSSPVTYMFTGDQLSSTAVWIYIVTADGNIHNFANGDTALTDVTGTVPVGTKHQMVQFQDDVYLTLNGQTDIYISVAGAPFTTLIPFSGSVPDGGFTLLSAFGRLWGIEADGQTIKYSDLLSPDVWITGSSGSIDMTAYWNNADVVTCLAACHDRLIVFGNKQIVIFGSPDVASEMYMEEIIPSIGSSSPNSIVHYGNDMFFCAADGVYSFSREIQQGNMAMRSISHNNKSLYTSFHNADLANTGFTNINACYSTTEGYMIVSFPSAGTQMVFDLRKPMEDGTYPTTVWSHTGISYAVEDPIYSTTWFGDSLGGVGKLGSAKNNNGRAQSMKYYTGWFDSDPNAGVMIIPKSARIIGRANSKLNVKCMWAYDFSSEYSYQGYDTSNSSTSYYGIDEYTVANYSGGDNWEIMNINLTGMGEYLRYGVEVLLDDKSFAIQSLGLRFKSGSLAR